MYVGWSSTLSVTNTGILFWIISSASSKFAAVTAEGLSAVIVFFAGFSAQIMFLFSRVCLAIAANPNDMRPRNESLFQLIGLPDALCSWKTSSQATFNSGVITLT